MSELSIDTAEDAAGQTTRTGRDVIAGYVGRLPEKPGVYRMIAADGDVLYVGKARSLKKRVASYARPAGHPNRIARMVALTAAMEFVVTETETEALLLEANLIKRLKPRFNVLLRDDKSFPYILITKGHPAPQIVKHRGARSRPGDYYGPFASTGAVSRTVNALQRAFLLRSCTDAVFESRTRPCLLYQIKRCSGPCTGEIGLEDYADLVDEARAFLSGKSQKVREALAMQMEIAAEQLEFETAALYRDRLAALSAIQAHQGVNPQTVEEADVFAVAQEGGVTCVQVFFFRVGQNWGNRAYYPRADKDIGPEEVLGAFLAQFYYDDKPVPRLALLSHEIEDRLVLEEALTTRSGRAVSVAVPQRGEKRVLVEHALRNAREACARRLAESSSQARLLDGFAETFGLDTPRRIEVYDNSHIQGTNPVGVMVVAGPEGFVKSQYRKFNIGSDVAPGDDDGMMREVLRRRFTRLLKEAGPRPEAETADTASPWPDAILIDGGAGQLSAAESVLAEMGIADLPVIAIAKGPDRDAGRERFFMTGREPFRLQPRDPVLYFVQRLRDEAHRFAIGAHRAKRKKAIGYTGLDEIPGIGPTRKRALLRHFGTAKAVSRAGLADLEAVPGISAELARQIYEFFHENPG